MAIICSRGQRRQKCSVGLCGKDSVALCDYPVERKGVKTTCDSPMCARHRHPVPNEPMSIGVKGIGTMSNEKGDTMSGQPSPYSDVPVLQAPAQVALKVDQIGRGTIIVNGIDLSALVGSTEIYSQVGRLTEVSLEIHAAHLTVEMEAALRVYIVKPDDAEVTAHGDPVVRFVEIEPESPRGGDEVTGG